MNLDDKEVRAFEALIVKRLREGCGEDHVPALTEKEKAALKSYQPGFIDKLIDEYPDDLLDEEPCQLEDEEHSAELAFGALDRGDSATDDTNTELRERRDAVRSARQKKKANRDRQDQ